MRSLRTRLLIAFALLSGVTAAAVAGAMYGQARNVILEKAQDSAVRQFTERVAAMTVPDPGALSDRDSFGVILYRGRPLGDDQRVPDIPRELRDKVATGVVAWQRVVHDGQAGLVMGMRLSDLEFYSGRHLSDEQDSIRELALLAWVIGIGSLVLSGFLAWLAANSVLRPVRDLDAAARRLGEGDLTTRVQVRGGDELAGVAQTFNTTAAALEKQVADARRFVADVSHELRTPLAAMTAVTDVLDEEAPHLTEDAGKAATLVSQETRNLTRLVNDLMEVSRFDSGAATLALDDVDVAEAVTATLRARRWTDVVTDLASLTARVDPRRLDVIVANLVGNALKHGAAPVSVTLRGEPGWVIIEVTDHGPGLDPQVLPQVFDRFYKADTARTRSEGSGLGLAIAWENARLHDGTLTAGNRPDGGAVFTLRLPSGGSR
ncbi:two-component sensor histidine kinase [Actinosynnema sp. ALI-1.44]|uniref:sensor histidine kinase n=1 Tax=Actinosynnema sp. ALI-1.44 TaxID=1933779 RepID=UPI00097C104E|nr:HAMP domain-containing sensor histidine kinase [Actinosynnema sp. ALI-1.44]ONI71108.1 two-component sensor histidine kinase [Actinosynnema sp. ALI-1.44]